MNFWTIYVFIIGLFFGSFANVVIYRIPRKKSIVSPPSSCPACGMRILTRDLVPVFSWLFLRLWYGGCRFCRAKINLQYPLVELICGLLFAIMQNRFSTYFPILIPIPMLVLAFIMITVSVIDWHTQEIPDKLLIWGIIAGIVWVAFSDAIYWANALLGALVGGMFLLIIDWLVLLLIKKDGFGYGDVKLMVVIGLFLGWQLTLVAFFFAFISGGVFAIFLIATGRANRGEYIAFAPFLCIGTLFSLWFGIKFADFIFI